MLVLHLLAKLLAANVWQKLGRWRHQNINSLLEEKLQFRRNLTNDDGDGRLGISNIYCTGQLVGIDFSKKSTSKFFSSFRPVRKINLYFWTMPNKIYKEPCMLVFSPPWFLLLNDALVDYSMETKPQYLQSHNSRVKYKGDRLLDNFNATYPESPIHCHFSEPIILEYQKKGTTYPSQRKDMVYASWPAPSRVAQRVIDEL